jgi:alkylation response protein AidB-like acyl-CoA dehydrogenase
MTFSLSDDQITIRDMARQFAMDRLAPHALEWDEKRHFPIDVIRETAALGMAGIYVREESGGTGLSRLDAAVIFEALSEGCPTIAAYISIHNMVAWMIDRFGSDAQRAVHLPALLNMDHLGAYCLTEPGSGSDAAALKTRAELDGDHYILTGQKQFISAAGSADLYLIMARTGGAGPKGISAFLVHKDTPGLSFGANEKKMGWNAQPTRAVIMDGMRIPAANRLGAEGDGFTIAMSGLDGGRLNIGACSLGGAQSALDKAMTYAGERKAFGKALNEMQSVQFKLADMASELEGARIMLYAAASAYDRQDPQTTMRCAMAKRMATDTGFKVANEALQIHGGYGYLQDYGIEKLVRDLRVHQILEGTNEIMRVIIARAMLSGNGYRLS